MPTAFNCHLLRHVAFCAALCFGACGDVDDDSDRYQDLDRLRVLAVRSEPADLAFGETATLSALVSEPKDRELHYEWSWCPSRADSTENFACNVSEAELARAWKAQDLPGSAPSYDLGTEPEATFAHLMAPELVASICQSLVGDSELPELALACLDGLKASVKLTVQTSNAEVTVIKSLSLLMKDVAAAERNTNPELGFSLAASDKASGRAISSNGSLTAGHSYKLTAGLSEAAAQTFTPGQSPDEEQKPKARRETLVASWFINVGELVAPTEKESFNEGDPRTTFVDGHNEFDALLDQGWKLPLTAKSGAHVYVVVRDERGGVGWSERSFDVKGGK